MTSAQLEREYFFACNSGSSNMQELSQARMATVLRWPDSVISNDVAPNTSSLPLAAQLSLEKVSR